MSRRWIVVALIFAGILISYIDRGNLGIAAPSIMQEFGFSTASMGLLLSAFFWTYAVFQIPVGTHRRSRKGIRLVYAGAFVLWSLASSAIGLIRGLTEILLLRMLLGLAGRPSDPDRQHVVYPAEFLREPDVGASHRHLHRGSESGTGRRDAARDSVDRTSWMARDVRDYRIGRVGMAAGLVVVRASR